LVIGQSPTVCGISANGSVACADWKGGTAFSKGAIDCLPKTPVLDFTIDRADLGYLAWVADDGAHVVAQLTCSVSQLPSGFGGVKQVVMEQKHLCTLDEAGSAACWTLNGASAEPVVKDHFTQVVTTTSEACGITATGTVRCWDDTGVEDVATSDFPYFLSTGVDSPPVVQLASDGEDKLCALFNDGLVLCNTTFEHGSVDQGFKLPDGEHVVEMAVADDHVCGIRADNTVLCVPYGCENCDTAMAAPAGFQVAP
jgi:hypothetical protein